MSEIHTGVGGDIDGSNIVGSENVDRIDGNAGDNAKTVAIGKDIRQSAYDNRRNVGGNFVGHDSISYENNEYLQFIRDQLMDVKVRVEFIEHAIEESKAKERNCANGPTWLQLGNMIVAALVVAALLYFGGGLYAVAHELQNGNVIQQRTQPYRSIP